MTPSTSVPLQPHIEVGDEAEKNGLRQLGIGRRTDPYAGMSDEERQAFESLFQPMDLFEPTTGRYWADLPFLQSVKYVHHVNSLVRREELAEIWASFRRNPFSPVVQYFKTAVLPGAGLLLEGYVLFSIGNVKPLLEAVFPTCWKDHTDCSATWVQSIEYLEILGIIAGQIIVGIVGDWLGRRFGLVQDAAIMLFGLLMLTASWGITLNQWVIFYAWSLFVYGIGVGGEYPMTATMGMETPAGANKISTMEDRLHRGRKVTSAFLMQGWGQFFNQVLLMLLLVIITGGDSHPPYEKRDAQFTYRMSFAIPAIGTAWLLYHRAFRQSYATDKQLQAAKKRGNVTGYDTQSLKLTVSHFGSRLVATAGTWFANDVFFYGNKLFQNKFIEVLTPGNKSVMVGWKYNLLNIAVSMVGYYMASFFIDNKFYGRKRMMIVGFMLDFILFVVPCFHFEFFTQPENIKAFQAMYFLSSFFNQFGPNSVTFLVAAEVFPAPIRASAHGFSAAIGKLGALLAAVLYNYIDTQTKFLVVPWFGLAGALLTILFLPDTTGLDLKEQERRWSFIKAGRGDEYHGIAIHPRHLSLYERMRGAGKNYDLDQDRAQKIDEMFDDWKVWHQYAGSTPFAGSSPKEKESVRDEVMMEGVDQVRSLVHYDFFAEDSRATVISRYFSRISDKNDQPVPSPSSES